MYKVLKVVSFGLEDSKLYSVFYCDKEDYKVFKKFDYMSSFVVVYDLHGCKVGDTIRIKKYYNLDNFEDIHYEIYKN